MKKRLVLWGEDANEKKHLYALDLREEDNKVDIYAFPLEIAKEEFAQKMMNEWRNGKEVDFPEGYQTLERPLNLSDTLLPEDVKVEQTDLINRAQTEWNFVVMSIKLRQSYEAELAEMRDRIERLENFDKGLWEELKTFWSKVQGQIRDKNLFGRHATKLRKATDEAFDKMKELRRKLEAQYREESKEKKGKFMDQLEDIAQKVEKGLGLKPLFEELKDIQRDFKKTKFTKEDGDAVWKKLDGLFKEIKEKRFGKKATNEDHSPKGRLERRYQGLQRAIQNMNSSIGRDKSDLKFENKRIDQTDGQLELQMRKAKIKMIEERIHSKENKLEDMLKTQKELESKIEREIEKERQQEIAKEKQKAQKEAEKKIREKMEKQRTGRTPEEEEKIAAAAKAIQGKKKSGSPSEKTATSKESSREKAPEDSTISSVIPALSTAAGLSVGAEEEE